LFGGFKHNILQNRTSLGFEDLFVIKSKVRKAPLWLNEPIFLNNVLEKLKVRDKLCGKYRRDYFYTPSPEFFKLVYVIRYQALWTEIYKEEEILNCF
jgi:hypothetical protein